MYTQSDETEKYGGPEVLKIKQRVKHFYSFKMCFAQNGREMRIL